MNSFCSSASYSAQGALLFEDLSHKGAYCLLAIQHTSELFSELPLIITDVIHDLQNIERLHIPAAGHFRSSYKGIDEEKSFSNLHVVSNFKDSSENIWIGWPNSFSSHF
ncbi:hypothetical protein Syun_029044 [Stephania yunnanensis]|uniref:Uncharacterized protein n=1 Tax=Stephania yunnanensis TaxID=152371 RepID=A0AAP0E4N3_9MAGN